MNRFIAIVLIYMINVFVSCMNETGNSKSVNPESIYFDYKVWGNEESNQVIVKLQYRYRDAEGITILPEHTGRVEFDGEILQADSSRMNGFYYEAMFPLKNASGKHNIVFTDLNNKQYKEEFDLKVFSLKTKLPKEIKRDDLVFEMVGLDTKDNLRVVATDTLFISEGINRIDSIINGRLTISVDDLGKLVNGPVQLEFIREYERPVKNGTETGGKLSITHVLKRFIILKD